MGLPSSPPRSTEAVAILPLRNSVLFPMSVVPINVGRTRSVELVERLAGKERALVGVIAQKNPKDKDPKLADLHAVGTLARIVKVIRLGNANYSMVLNGLGRFRVVEPVAEEPYLQARVERLREEKGSDPDLEILANALRAQTREMLRLMPDLPRETAGILDNVLDPGALADLIASNFPEEHASMGERQMILEAVDPRRRVQLVTRVISKHLEVLRKKDQIAGQIQNEIARTQREFVLREQMRSILEELGEASDEDELDELAAKVLRAELEGEALKAARKQLSRLRSMQPQSAEYNVSRTYVEWLADLPWKRTTPDDVAVSRVQQCLDEDHYGLESAKKRIVEYSAVRQLRKDRRGPILLFVGPPGVGKTSLGRSIARAVGRKYGRIALGGVRDEAEIRGHRRTYVGALPGRIVQGLKRVGSKNPVLVLDEVDKMGADMRGDPAAALLEVLDPEQNHEFVDHYLGVPFDLSEVMFLATANELGTIPAPLRDRMEVIEVAGYTRMEKREIALQFLALQQLRDHGLSEEQVEFTAEGLEAIIDYYTRESGVRGLEREIGAVCRSFALQLAEGKIVEGQRVTPEVVGRVLGIQRFHPELAEKEFVPGVATGLGAGVGGGTLLFVEATSMPGSGQIHLTGSLRDIMKESAQTAVSYVRSHSDKLMLDPEWLKKRDLHVHIPRAMTAKDAAGVGLAMYVAVVSLLLGVSTLSTVAVAGELTLRGNVLPVGEVKAKILAAHRAGIRKLLLPARNQPDVEEVPEAVRSEIEIQYVSKVDEVLAEVLDPLGVANSVGSTGIEN